MDTDCAAASNFFGILSR